MNSNTTKITERESKRRTRNKQKQNTKKQKKGRKCTTQRKGNKLTKIHKNKVKKITYIYKINTRSMLRVSDAWISIDNKKKHE